MPNMMYTPTNVSKICTTSSRNLPTRGWLRYARRILRRFVELPPKDSLLVVISTAVLTVLAVAVKVVSFRLLLVVVRRIAGLFRRQCRKVGPANRIVWAVSAVTRQIPMLGNCLSVAFAAKLLLAASGHPCSLRIGVSRSDSGQLSAHAWLEDNGIVIIGSVEHDQYAPLPIFDRVRE